MRTQRLTGAKAYRERKKIEEANKLIHHSLPKLDLKLQKEIKVSDWLLAVSC